jgi:hypothetical protein
VTSPPDDPYRCGVCGAGYPVPSLARDCEMRHAHPLRAEDVQALLAKDID